MIFSSYLKAKSIFQYAKLGSCQRVASNIGYSKLSISNWTKDTNDYTNYIKSSSNRHSYKINKSILKKESLMMSEIKEDKIIVANVPGHKNPLTTVKAV